MPIRVSALPRAVIDALGQITSFATRLTSVEQTVSTIANGPDISALLTRLNTAEALLAARTQGVATLSANIAVASTVSIPIVFEKPMPDTTYKIVSAMIEGTTGLHGVLFPVLPLVNRSTTGCTINIRNAGLHALGLNATIRVTVEKF